MKRLSVFVMLLITSAMVLSACGGGGAGSGSGGGANTGGAVSAGASGIKDPALLGKWITADGGTAYDFKDDFSVILTAVGAETKSVYNVAEGGTGSGKIEIGESSGKVVWNYKITDKQLDMTTPDGRARKLRKAE